MRMRYRGRWRSPTQQPRYGQASNLSHIDTWDSRTDLNMNNIPIRTVCCILANFSVSMMGDLKCFPSTAQTKGFVNGGLVVFEDKEKLRESW